jgi:LAS superfamily LD-carboxypeptidase LdcB
MEFSESDKRLIFQFLENISKSTVNGLSDEQELWDLTTLETKSLINKIVSLNPEEYGFRGKQLPNESVPKDAVKIASQVHDSSGEYELDNNTYLPKKVFIAYDKMAEEFNKENIHRKLLIGSGYRSPAFQIVTLIYILAKVYDFDLSQTLKRVAMPRYSQHCSVSNTAIDMLNIDGEPSDNDPQKFGESIEYTWLLKNANKFNFNESYPPNNPDGIMWEPWHWQFLE